MLSRKPKFSINQIIQFNTLFYISVFAITVGISGISLYRLQKEKVNENLVMVRKNLEDEISVEIQFVQKNLNLMKSYLQLLKAGQAGENITLFSGMVAEALQDRRVQFNGYLALEKPMAQKYFHSDAFAVGSHRNLKMSSSIEYFDPKYFVRLVSQDPFYQSDPKQVWYQVAKRSHQLELTDIYYDEQYMKKWMASAGLGIYDSQGQFQGMVGIDILLDELSLEVEKIHLGETGGTLLIDTRTNRILTRLTGSRAEFIQVNERYEAPKFDERGLEEWNSLLHQPGEILYFWGNNKKRYVVTVAMIPNVPWAVICFQEYYEAYKSVFWEITLISLIGALGLIILLWVSNRFRGLVTEPLQNLIYSLAQNIRSARKNEIMKVEVSTTSYREVQRVSRLVNRLIRIVNSRTQKHIQTVEEQRSKAMHSARMASVGQMAGNVAHEINSPLAAISLHAEVLAKELEKKNGLDPVTSNRIRVIRQMTERIAKIVRGFLAISRDGERDPLQNFTLSEIIHETLVISQSRLNTNGVSLQVDPVPDVMIKCRAVQVSQVLLNLLNNSHDAVQNLPEKWIRIEFSEVNSRLSIVVIDSGKGIPKNLSEKIMEPFFTTKDVNKGTGLGLSISKSIIEAHGGRLYYDPSSAHTRFVIELPTV